MIDSNTSVIVADDVASVRRMIRGVLHRLGMKRVREVSNGREALDELRRQKADLLITDWHMPGISGLKLLQLIRQDEDLKDVPVLMVTARSNREDVIAAAQGGVNHYIVKPFDAKTLAEKLTRIFSPSDAGED